VSINLNKSNVDTINNVRRQASGFAGLGVSALAGQSRRIFQGEKLLRAPSFGREVKTVGSMSLIYGM
jgi:hypothetical protein